MKRILKNQKYFKESLSKIISREFTVVSAILLFFPIDDFLIRFNTFYVKIGIFISLILAALLVAIFKTYTFKKIEVIHDTQRSINLFYGDLMDFAFPKKESRERIVVINVNTAFDVILESANVINPLVSRNTIHGQWIEQMNKRGMSSEKLNVEIKKSLREQNLTCKMKNERIKGNKEEYPKGTIAKYRYKNTTFYLLAFSSFDEKNNAQNTQEEIRTTILKLIEFIGNNSQGEDVYIPLMGSGYSRAQIDDETALELLVSNLKLNKNKFIGDINVVVYEKNRDKVAIGG